MPKKLIDVPLGKELDWTDEEIEALLGPSASDFIQGEELWEESVDPVFSDLLFADDELPEGSKA